MLAHRPRRVGEVGGERTRSPDYGGNMSTRGGICKPSPSPAAEQNAESRVFAAVCIEPKVVSGALLLQDDTLLRPFALFGSSWIRWCQDGLDRFVKHGLQTLLGE